MYVGLPYPEKLSLAPPNASQTFRTRAAKIADHAHNVRGPVSDGVDFLRGLDESERQVFKSAHEGPKGVKNWSQDLRRTT